MGILSKDWRCKYCLHAVFVGLSMLAYSATAWARSGDGTAGPTWEIIAFAGFGLALSLAGMHFRGVVTGLQSRIDRNDHRLKNHDLNSASLLGEIRDIERRLPIEYARKEDMRDMIQLALSPMSQQVQNLAQNVGGMREAISEFRREKR